MDTIQNKIFFFELFEEEKREIIKHINNFQWKSTEYTLQEYDKNDFLNSEIISIRTQSIVNIDEFHNLKAIISRSTGYDHLISIKKQCEKVKLGYLPLYCYRSVAEHCFFMIFCLLKNFRSQIEQMTIFNRSGLTGCNILNKNLLVVGVGNIGYEILTIGTQLGMNAKGVDILKNKKDVDYISIEEGLKWADVIVCSMNLTKDNFDYFDKDILSKAMRKPFFINISRGEITKSSILLEALEQGFLSGIGLDVYDDEPNLSRMLRSKEYDKNNKDLNAVLKMINRNDCILTPHNAFNTVESVEEKCKQTVTQIEEYIKNQKFIWEI